MFVLFVLRLGLELTLSYSHYVSEARVVITCCLLLYHALFSVRQLCDGLTLEELEELQLEIKQYQELIGENG